MLSRKYSALFLRKSAGKPLTSQTPKPGRTNCAFAAPRQIAPRRTPKPSLNPERRRTNCAL